VIELSCGRSLCGCCTLVLLAPLASVRGQDRPEALVQRAIEAAGGRARVEASPALQWQGHAVIHVPGRDITILGTWSVQPPDSAVVATYDSVQGPRSTRRLIVAGTRGWMQRDSQMTAMPNAILTEERHQFYLYALLRLVSLEAPGVRLTRVVPDSAGNTGLLVESPGRLPVTMYFDRDARVVRMRTTFAADSGPVERQDIRFEGTIESNGVRWFRKIMIHRGGQPYFDMELRTLQALPRLNEPLLRGPPVPPDDTAGPAAGLVSSSQLLASHPFPLIRGGGLFLLLVGLSIMLGVVARRRLWASFIAGVIIATAVVALTAIRLTAPLGRPTAFQLEMLMVAVFVEMIAVGWLGSRLRAAAERQRILSILLVVGAHFLVMAPVFGPLIVLLGLLSVVNAVVGLRARTTPWVAFWLIDGLLKAGIGGAMFWYAPRATW